MSELLISYQLFENFSQGHKFKKILYTTFQADHSWSFTGFNTA